MINLEKYEERKKECRIVLDKFKLLSQKVAVKFIIDKSGSMDFLYMKNIVQNTFERILPLADLLDDDHTMQVYSFNESCSYVGEANVNNAEGFINSNIRVGGGTNYAPIIKAILKSKTLIPTFAIVITDGDCWDKTETEKIIKEASKENIFFQFVGIGSEPKTFLQNLDNLSGRYIDNAGFCEIDNLENISDIELYNLLINELPKWLDSYVTPPVEQNKKGFFNKLFGK